MSDWSTTVLGGRDGWPAELQTAAAICEASPLPMQLWWGDELVLFYNAATIDLLGTQHPGALGKPASEAWPELAGAIHQARRDGKPARVDVHGLAFTLAPIAGGVVSTCDTKERLLALLGHELRNELTPLMMTVGAMKLRGSDVEVLERQVQHLRALVDEVLDISRIARGKLEIRSRRVEVAPLVARAGGDPRGIAPGLAIYVDPERFVQILEMLAPGGGISVRPLGDRLRVEVSGPPPRDLPLALARGLVELHGGHVDLRDGIAIEVPLHRDGAPPPPPSPVTPVRTNKRVLIVEDNDETARALRAALEQLGYTVALAHDGPVALSLARTFDPQIALLDIGLPVMDGYELARRLRAMNIATRELHFVAVTALDDRERSATEGFAEHLRKPVDLARLERVVGELAVAANSDE